MEEKKTSSFLKKLKEKAKNSENYGGKVEKVNAQMDARICPNCGAGRNKQDGLTLCAYCGFEFIKGSLSNGIYIKKEDNSRQM